jgi:signal recognition particle subunit SEC65
MQGGFLPIHAIHIQGHIITEGNNIVSKLEFKENTNTNYPKTLHKQYKGRNVIFGRNATKASLIKNFPNKLI